MRAVRAKLVEAGYVTLFDNLPSGIGDMTNKEAVELMGRSFSDGRFKNIGSYRINTKPIFDDLGFTSAQFVDAQRPCVMVNQPEEYLRTNGSVRKLIVKLPSFLTARSTRASKDAKHLLQLSL